MPEIRPLEKIVYTSRFSTGKPNPYNTISTISMRQNRSISFFFIRLGGKGVLIAYKKGSYLLHVGVDAWEQNDKDK